MTIDVANPSDLWVLTMVVIRANAYVTKPDEVGCYMAQSPSDKGIIDIRSHNHCASESPVESGYTT